MALANAGKESTIEAAPSTLVLERERERRSAEFRRFNRLYLYLPLGFVIGMALLAFGTMVWATLIAGRESQQELGSGLADLYITLSCLAPLTLVCAIFPAVGVGALYWRRKNGPVVHTRLQRIFRKVDNAVVTTTQKTENIQPKIAAPIIRGRGVLAYIQTLIQQLFDTITSLFRRT